jgi:hypothetical protein
MANPNVVNVQLIRGKTSVRNYVKMASRFLLRNNSSSNEVLKVNSIIATSRSTRHENVSISYVTTTGTFNLISDFNIPPNSSVNLLQKETSIYLEEDTSLNVFSRSSNDSISVVCSYEQIASTIVSDRSDNYDNDSIEPLPSIGNESIVTSNLVLSLDAANSSSYIANGTAWIDLTSNKRVGRLINGPTYNANGTFNFDGTNDYISLDSQNFVGTGTAPFTGELWFFNNRTLASGAYTMFVRVKQDNEFFFVLYNNGGTHVVYAVFRGFTQWATTVTASDYTNKWVCVHFAYTGGDRNTAASYKIYLNGSLIPTGTSNLGAAGGTGSNCNILGADGNSGCNVTTAFHGGMLSVYRLYNRELNLAEIQQNFNALRGRYGI